MGFSTSSVGVRGASSKLSGQSQQITARRASAARLRAGKLSLAAAAAAGLMGLLGGSSSANATVGTWNTTTSGNWDTATNWVGSVQPGAAAGDTANLSFNITSNEIITLVSGQKVGFLNIGDFDQGNTYQVSGNTLTFDNGGSNALLTQLAGSDGDTFTNALTLNSNLVVTNEANNLKVLKFFGPISGAGTVTVNTGPSPVLLNASNGYASTTLSGGYLQIENYSALGTGNLTINGGTFDAPTAVTLSATGALPNNTQTWNGNFTYNGSQNFNMGTGAVTLGANVAVDAQSSTLVIGGNIGESSPSKSLTLISGYGGNAILGGNNTYTGSTTLIGAGGTFNFLGSTTTSGITVNGTTLALGNNLQLPNGNALGTGTLTMMQGSTLSFAYGTSGANFALTTNNPQTWAGDFSINNGSFNQAFSMGSGVVTLTGNRTILGINGTSPLAFSVGPITDNGSGYGLTVEGNVALHLTAASNYSGGTFLYGGVNNDATSQGVGMALDFTAAGAPANDLLLNSSALTMTGSDFILNGAAFTQNSQTLGNLTINGTDYIGLTSGGGPGSGTSLTLGNTWTRGPGAVVDIHLPTISGFGATILNSIPNGATNASSQSASSQVLPYAIVQTAGTAWFGTVVNGGIVNYTSANTLASGTGSDPTNNYANTNSSLVLGGPTAVNSLLYQVTNSTTQTLDLGGNTLTVTSGGVLTAFNTTSNLSDGTITAGPSAELIIANVGSTLNMSAGVTNNHALTFAGLNTINFTGTVASTPTVNLNNAGTLNMNGSTMTGVTAINIGLGGTTTLGILGTSATPLGNTLAIATQSIATTTVAGLVTGNGSTAINIVNTAQSRNANTTTFTGGLFNVSSISFTSSAPFSFGNNNNGGIFNISVGTVTGLTSLNLSDSQSNAIAAPMVLGNSFAVTQTNFGPLTISGGITGNGSTALSFRGPGTGSTPASPNVISTTTLNGVASITNDGANQLTISANVNNGSGNLTLANSSYELIKVSGVITANNLNIVGGNGTHGVWYGSSSNGGGPNADKDQVDLVGTANNVISGNTSVTDAMLYMDYTAAGTNFTKINPTGSLTLSASGLVINNTINAAVTVGSTTIGAGQSYVDLYTGTGSMTLGTVTNTNFGTADLYAENPGTGSAVKVSGTVNTPIGGWATIGADPATIGTGGIVTAPGANGASAYVALTNTSTGITSTTNTNFSAGTSLTMLAGATITANELVINTIANTNAAIADQSITLTNPTSLTSGGIIAVSGGPSMTLTGSGTIYGDSSNSGNSPLYVTVGPITTSGSTLSQSPLIINVPVVGTGTGTLVKAGYSELILTQAAGYSGGTVINAGNLRADGSALSAGPLTLNSAGAYATYGLFNRSIGTSANQVSFGAGGGGFSAEGGNLTVNLGGAGASVTAAQLGGNLVLGNNLYSTGILNFQNPINLAGAALTLTTSNVVDGGQIGSQSNLGTAYAKLTGGISGTGSLTIYADGYHNGNNPNGGGQVNVPDGLVAVPGGLNVSGPITIHGAALYVPSMATLASNTVALTAGGVIATNGTANITLGAAAGQVQFIGPSTAGNGGGFAAVGGPLVVHVNNDQPTAVNSTSFSFYNLTLGSPFATNGVDYQSPIDVAGGSLNLSTAGPVPNMISGQIIGGSVTNGVEVSGAGVLVLSNANNTFSGPVTITGGAMLRAGSATALGENGGNLSISGTFDMNGYSFSHDDWTGFGSSATGPLGLPALINTNTTTPSTLGSATDNYIVLGNSGQPGIGQIGGPGSIIMPGQFAGTITSNSRIQMYGTGTVTLSGDTSNIQVAASDVLTELDTGMNQIWDYSTDTGTKTFVAIGTGDTGTQTFTLANVALKLKGNASTAVNQNLPITGANYLSAAGSSTSNVTLVGLTLSNGANSVNLTTAGANLNLSAGGITVSNRSTVDFSTNTSSGGTAAINFGSSGLAAAITVGGTGYTASQTSLPVTISAANIAGGVQAIAHAATNASGVVTAIYVDNWGSGYTSNPTVTVTGTNTSAASAVIYFNNPVTGIIGGWATYAGTDWAYRDTNGNIQPLPSGSYQNDPGTWSALANGSNVSLDTSGYATGPTATMEISTLRFTGASNTSNTLTNVGTLTIGCNITNQSQDGGILVTSAVGANNVTITGGNIKNAVSNDNLDIHQNNTAGSLIINSTIQDAGNSGLSKDGPGTLVLNANDSFNSDLRIYAGTIQVPTIANSGTAQPLGTGGTWLILGGGTLQVNTLANATPVSTNHILTLGVGGGSLDASGAGTVSFNGTNTRVNASNGNGVDTYLEAVGGDGYSNFTLTGSGNGVMNGGIFLATPPSSAGGYGSNFGYGDVVEGFTQLTKSGSGTWTLNAYNYWQGGTIISQGTLALGLNPANNILAAANSSGLSIVTNTSFADAISPNAPVTINSTGTLQLNYPEVSGEVRLTGGSITNGGAGVLWGRYYNFSAGSVSVPLVGDFSALGKITSGTVTLSSGGSTTYSGNTIITAGTLAAGAVNALSPNSAVTISGGILDTSAYNNSIASLVVGSGGTLNLGSGTVLTDLGAATFAGTLNVLGTPASSPDIIMTYTGKTGTFTPGTIPAGYGLTYLPTALELVSTGPASLTWNNTGGSGNGTTWDTVQQNWNSGSGVTTYSDTALVTFNDTNNGNYNVSITSTVHPGSVTVNTTHAYLFNGSGGIAGTTGLSLSGGGSLTLAESNSYTGGTNVSAGTLILANAGALPAGYALTIAPGAKVVANNLGTAYASTVSTLNMSGGTFDLNNNDLVIHNGLAVGTNLNTVTGLITTGFNGGGWNGASGILSTAAATSANHLTALGVIVNDSNGVAGGGSKLYGSSGTIASTFGGTAPALDDILVKYTYYGDANLSGNVDGSDYSIIDNTFLKEQSSGNISGWQNGDFNYDGVVDGSDYTLIDNAFNSQGSVIAAEIATPTAQIAGGGASSSVPEPTTLGLVGIGALGLLGRRSRRRK